MLLANETLKVKKITTIKRFSEVFVSGKRSAVTMYCEELTVISNRSGRTVGRWVSLQIT